MAAIVLLLFIFYILIRISIVQTEIAKRATAFYSKKLNTKVEIGKVRIDFFNTVVLQEIFVADRHNDTLLYAKRLEANIDNLDLDKQTLLLDEIILSGATGKVIKYKGENDFNFKFIIDELVPKKSKDSKGGWDVQFDKVILNDVNFVYKIAKDTSSTTGINFSDIRGDNIHSKISGIKIEKDTIYASIEALSLKEKSGFVLKNLFCYFTISPLGMNFKNLQIHTPKSTVQTQLAFKYKEYNDVNDFINKVDIKASLANSSLELSDLAYFAPALYGIKKSIIISGDVTGKVIDIKGRKLDIAFGNQSHFLGNIDMIGLPDIETTFINVDIKKLTTNKFDIEKIQKPPFIENKLIDIPENLGLLGQVTAKGNFSGFINDFVAYANFNTALGLVSSDISMRTNEKGLAVYSGKIKTNGFNIGKLINVEHLGKISMNANVSGKGLQKDNIVANIKGIVAEIDFKGYNYKNVNVEGKLAKNLFSGKLDINESNIKMDFAGTIDFNKKFPEFDFDANIKHADIAALKLIKSDKPTSLATLIMVNISGNDIDNILGEINITNTTYREGEELYKLSELNLNITEPGFKNKVLKLDSDFAKVDVTGELKILQMINSMRELAGVYIPALKIRKKKNKSDSPNENFQFSILLKNTSDITKLFFPKIKISPNTLISGNYNSYINQFNLKGNSNLIDLYGNKITNWNISAKTEKDELQLITTGDKLSFSDSANMENISFSAKAKQNKVDFNLAWKNSSKHKYTGDLKGYAIFEKSDKLDIKLLPSEVSVNDSLWTSNSTNLISIDSSFINVTDFVFQNNNQLIKINGAISKDKKDQLIIALSDFNLAFINLFTKASGLKIKGFATGSASVSDVYSKPRFASSLDFKSFGINNELFGDGSVNSFWDPQKDLINLNGTFSRGMVPNLQFTGSYYPNKKEDNIDIDLFLQSLDMQFFKEYVKEYCSDFFGKISGNANLKGTFQNPVIAGNMKVQAKKVRVNYLNTFYSFSADVNIEPTSFGVENLIVYDQNANTANVTGKLYHDNFKNFQLDFDINAKKFMMLNTTESLNKLYYGKAYATGIVNFFGFLDNIIIDATVKTERGTQFNIPLTSESEISESDFIRFVKKDTSKLIAVKDYQVNLKGIELNFNLDVTPDAEVQLIFDSKIGDIIKGRGTGNIKLGINTLGKFNMYGDYNIESGDYLFTLKNVINKRFEIERGSTIKWSGDPYDAYIDLIAVYRPRASLKPFFPEDKTGIYNKRYPVDVKLLMTNKLMNPDIDFDIYLPSIDENTRQAVDKFINNEAEMNKQVFSLIMLRSFSTPSEYDPTGNATAGAGSATASELLSNQVSNWLSQLSNDFDIGVNYNPGTELSNEELDVMLSKDLFNDRINIEGNVGVSGNNQSTTTQNTTNIVGDVSVDVRITEEDKLRMKFFNRANENTLLRENAPYTQGVGILYREEFSTLSELYRRYLNKLKKKK